MESHLFLNENIKDSALFVDQENIDNIVRSMNKILSDGKLRFELTKRCKEIKDKFDWKKTASKLDNIFINL